MAVLVLWVVLAGAGSILQTGTAYRAVRDYAPGQASQLRAELIRFAVQVILLAAASVRVARPELVAPATDLAGLYSAYAGFLLSILTFTGRVLDFRDRGYRF